MATTQSTADTSAAPATNDDDATHAANKAALDSALLGKPAAARTKPAGKSTKAKPAGRKTPAKKGTKPTTRKPAKPAASSAKSPTGKRKDEPLKGELKGASLANYRAVLEVLPKLPADAMNANQVAAKLSDKAGKVVWPIPTKKYLETAVARNEAVPLVLVPGKPVRYHLPAAKKGRK